MVKYRIPTEESIQDDLEEKANLVHSHVIADLATTGTRSDAVFLRGDGTWAVPPGTGGSGETGVTDHGSLTGLTDDDHPQYYNQTRGDARYSQVTHTHTATGISDSTATGRAVLTAASQAAARTAIGAGTSDLIIGTTSTTAKAGDYTPTKSTVGLANVDNTSDAAKPLSTAATTALNAKADKSLTVATVLHDGTAGGGTRPTGYLYVEWVNPVGTNFGRPTNMQAGDIWETDA